MLYEVITQIGAALALRSLSAETAGFRQFRTSLIAVSLGVMVLALLVAWLVASRITGPVRNLVGLVDRARVITSYSIHYTKLYE